MAHSSIKSKVNVQLSKLPENSVLHCEFCNFSTGHLSSIRRHYLNRHGKKILRCKDCNFFTGLSFWFCSSTNRLWVLETLTGSLYLEPPDVRRQLNHYTMMAHSSIKSKVNVQLSKLPENSVLHCEFCNFSTGHLSSIRRHYLNRHGKKILRCKDCNFFTGLRKTLEMHMERGHSTCQSKPTHQKDLCCPFCLYQTKNKNNMIDHIVLHREERVVPIEVRRPKLSRCHQGIIFGSKKVFSLTDLENQEKMNAPPPPQYNVLEKCIIIWTLILSMQVMRNHELVGQVSLDQLEASVDNVPVTEEEHLSNMDQLDEDREDVEMEDFLCSSFTEQKRFTCEFCGRNLVNSSELKRHVMRSFQCCVELRILDFVILISYLTVCLHICVSFFFVHF
uniref:C2H2-type domain-containing protein n=1 Tax=Neolamprologus brichardi TaxID=32507 RepID=A0A3Q4IEF0_NEOBR